MATLEYDETSKRYRIRFRYANRSFKRSIKTGDRREAEEIRGRVEETIRLLERGRLTIPPKADPGTFIVSDGKLNEKPVTSPTLTLGGLFTLYDENIPVGAKEASTLEGEKIHRKHLLKHLRAKTAVQSLGPSDMQAYVEHRLQESWRSKPIRPDTVKKELTTFRLTWNWGLAQGYLTGVAPTKGLRYPKTEQKPPFMIREEIEKIIGRGGLTKEQVDGLWDCRASAATETRQRRPVG